MIERILLLIILSSLAPVLRGQAMADTARTGPLRSTAIAGHGGEGATCQLPSGTTPLREDVRKRSTAVSMTALSPAESGLDRRAVGLPPVVAGSRRGGATRPSTLALGFIENRGQFDARASHYLRTSGQTLWLTSEGIVFDLLRAKPAVGQPGPSSAAAHGKPAGLERLVFAQDLVGARSSVVVEGRQPLAGAYNYFVGEPATWRTGVRAFAEVVYRDVWEGIDLKLYGNGPHFEQEFIVKPGGDPGQIHVAYRGIEGLRVAKDGSLLIRTAFGEIRESNPRIYQEIGGRRVEVAGRFKLMGERAYSFELGPYERRYALVIDPTLIWSTYLGGSQNENVSGTAGFGGVAEAGIAVDARGDPYVTGTTFSNDFPTVAPFQGSLQGQTSAFVTKLNATGSGLFYSTYIGALTSGHAIAVDPAGAAYITGQVDADAGGAIPVSPGAVHDTPGGRRNAFVTKLAADGSLGYSTYLPISSTFSTGTAIAVDPAGHAYVAGGHELRGNVWVRKLNPTGTAFLYSASIGGSGSFAGTFESAGGIAIDAEGNAYVTGTTASPDFPTTPGAFQQSGPSSLGSTGIGMFVTKLAPTGSRVYSTLLAGDRGEEAFGIAVDLAGHAYVTGYTLSSNFPTTPGAFQTARRGGQDAFLTKLKPDGSGLVYSTLLGGSGGGASSIGRGIAVDGTGSAHVTGVTTAGDFPTTPDALQPPSGAGQGSDVFLTKLNVSGSALLYSTYLGGAGFSGQVDEGYAIVLDLIGDAYITGRTNASVDFPTTPSGFFAPFQRLNAGGSDAFVAKFSTGTPTGLTVTSIVPSSGGDTGTVTVYIHGAAFAPHATLTLVRPGEPQIVATQVSVAPAGRVLSATFDFVGKPQGSWDVVVRNPGGASVTLPQGFTIESGRGAQTWADVIGRDSVMAGRPGVFFMLLGNRGNVDALASAQIEVTPKDLVVSVPPPAVSDVPPSEWEQSVQRQETEETIAILFPTMWIPPGFIAVLPVRLTAPTGRTGTTFSIRVVWFGR